MSRMMCSMPIGSTITKLAATWGSSRATRIWRAAQLRTSCARTGSCTGTYRHFTMPGMPVGPLKKIWKREATLSKVEQGWNGCQKCQRGEDGGTQKAKFLYFYDLFCTFLLEA